MPIITLPDGSQKTFDAPVTGTTVATTIGAGLLKAAVAMNVNGKEMDLSETIAEDSNVIFLTAKDERGLDAVRHTLTAQCLARAVKELYPYAKLAIGPTIDHGFYYDVDFSAGAAFSADDLPKLENKMRAIMGEKNTIERQLWDAEKTKQYFADRGEKYKVDIIERAIDSGELINGNQLSVYVQSIEEQEDFVDLCRGPHAPSTGSLTKAFTLTNIAGAYWRGDSSTPQITRIYGLAFATKEELADYQHMLEEAKKRDHRKLGKELDLFHLQDEAPGQVFWHANGWTIYTELQKLIREKLTEAGYIEVNTPQRVHNSLYKASGHWDKFGTENMFIIDESADGKDDQVFAMKPMNCPCHVQIFNTGNKSYRDLPLRMAEFGSCMRNEAKGALHGIMRVTTMTQDDAHIFCTPDQLQDEALAFCTLLGEVYKTFGFTDYFVKLSDRPEQRVGEDAIWDKSEKALADACDNAGLKWSLNPGEGAFYGPKLEFVLRDCIGRDWQCGTLQVDFNLPVRLQAEFDNEAGTKENPVMLHRAILGSLERFTGILIENMEGRFPTWLAPTQVMIVPITERHVDYAHQLKNKLFAASVNTVTGKLRLEVDDSNERMQKKILLAQQQKVPYMLIIGDKEMESGTAAVRLRNGTDLGALTPEQIIERLSHEITTRTDNAENAHKEAEAA